MRAIHRVAILPSALMLIAGSGAAIAQQGTPVEAQAAFGRLLQQYQSFRTYSDRVTLRETETTRRGTAGPLETIRVAPMTLAFDREGRVALQGVAGSTVTDGETIWRVSPDGSRYFAERAPQDVSQLKLTPVEDLVSMNQIAIGHPVLGMLLGDVNMEGGGLEEFGDVTGMRRESEDGREYDVITASMVMRHIRGIDVFAGGERPRSPVELWVDATSGLLRSVRIDFTGSRRAMFDRLFGGVPEGMMPVIEGAVTRYTIEEIRIDEDLDASLFTLDTTDRAEVENLASFFEFEGEVDFDGFAEPEGLEFIHNPAPPSRR